MRTNTWRAAALPSLLGAFLPGLQASAQGPPARTIEEFLASEVRLDLGQLAAVAQGEIVAKLLPVTGDRDVTVAGVVHVDVPRSFFVDLQLDFQQSLRRSTRVGMGIFSEPARTTDVAELEVTDEIVEELQDCRPNSCDYKLPGTDMERLKATINLSSRDAADRVTSYVRQRFVEYVTDYREHGNAAMVVYEDRGTVRSSEAFAEMLADASYLYRYVPTLQRYLLNYPEDTLPGATEAIYWSLDELRRMRRVLSINHVNVYSPPELPGTTLVGTKQIYADHYFEAGLETLTAIDRTDAAGNEGISLLLLRRYRFDQLPRGFLLNLRARVSGAIRDQARADLTRLKSEYERSWSISSTR